MVQRGRAGADVGGVVRVLAHNCVDSESECGLVRAYSGRLQCGAASTARRKSARGAERGPLVASRARGATQETR